MHATTSESDITSISPSSSSPKAYYVDSPSLDSNDEIDKCSSTNSPSPSGSPSYPSMATSTSTAASGASRNCRRWNKHYCNVVDEENEAEYNEECYEGNRCARAWILALSFGLALVGTCLVIWGSSRPYKTQVSVKSLRVHNLYFGEGSDRTGVPTRFITINCSASMVVYNPATSFGIQVSFQAANLLLSQIIVATGQVKKYYQPKRSRRTMWVRLAGHGVPLYGAATALMASNESEGIRFMLELEMESKGYLVGNLVKTKHMRHVLCSLTINSNLNKEIHFTRDSCKYV